MIVPLERREEISHTRRGDDAEGCIKYTSFTSFVPPGCDTFETVEVQLSLERSNLALTAEPPGVVVYSVTACFQLVLITVQRPTRTACNVNSLWQNDIYKLFWSMNHKTSTMWLP
jgi:hypothetical protein